MSKEQQIDALVDLAENIYGGLLLSSDELRQRIENILRPATPAAPDRATAPEGEVDDARTLLIAARNMAQEGHAHSPVTSRINDALDILARLTASPQVQGGEAVAWQCRHRSSEPHEPWWNIPRETYEAQRSAALWSDVFEYRALAALPPPPAEGEAN